MSGRVQQEIIWKVYTMDTKLKVKKTMCKTSRFHVSVFTLYFENTWRTSKRGENIPVSHATHLCLVAYV